MQFLKKTTCPVKEQKPQVEAFRANLPFLVPTFDPSKDDAQIYQQKVQLVLFVWPAAKISEFIARLTLSSSGSAFAKLQLHLTELCANDAKGLKRLIEILRGLWGRTGLEKRYSDAEKAIYTNATNSKTRVMTRTWPELISFGQS